MDIQIEKKKGIRSKHWRFIAAGALVLIAGGWIVFGNHDSTLRVQKQTLIVATAEKRTFFDFVRIDGQVQPIAQIQLSSLEGGIVEEILAEEGSNIKKGDVLLRLSNPNLDLSILNSEAELAEKQNFLRNTMVTMEQEKLNNRNEKLSADLDVKRKERNYRQQEALFREELIAHETYLQAKEDYELAREKQLLLAERLKQDSLFRSVQIDQMQESLDNMRQNLMLVRRRIENLRIKSPIDGELGLLDVVAGQNVAIGQKVGQINNLSDYKLEALIDEHYIDRIRKGLEGSLERQNKKYTLRVRKVFPEVREGKFKTELGFTSEYPENIRSGQTYFVNLELGLSAEAVLIPKGSFFQTTGGKWIFVIDRKQNKAYRRKIRIGRQNPQFYEVTEGLAPGEEVILSGYEQFKDNEILILE